MLEIARRHLCEERSPAADAEFLAILREFLDSHHEGVRTAQQQHVRACRSAQPEPDLICLHCGHGAVAAFESAVATFWFFAVNAPVLVWRWASYRLRRMSRGTAE